MLKVKKIINDAPSSNMYVLFEEGQNNAFLIDVSDVKVLFNELPKDLNIRGIFLTHTHFDHIAGINELVSRFPGCSIYTSKYGEEALYDDRKNFSFYYEHSTIYEGQNVILLSSGDEIQLFNNVMLYVIETPGHCPSCLTYYTDNYIFAGDSYIPNVKVVTKLPYGDKKKAETSIEHILSLAENRIVYAGHDVDKWKSIL